MPRDASVETSQRIRLNFNTSLPIGERVTENKRFGAYSPVGSFQLPTVNYDSYSGANRTRKFPLNLAKANASELDLYLLQSNIRYRTTGRLRRTRPPC